MSKYSEEELHHMAHVCMDAKKHGDIKYQILLQAFSSYFRLTPEDVDAKIQEMIDDEKFGGEQ